MSIFDIDIEEQEFLKKLEKHLLEVSMENSELDIKIDLSNKISPDIFDNSLEIDLGLDNFLELKIPVENIENNNNIEINNNFSENLLNNHIDNPVKNENIDKSKRNNKKRKKNNHNNDYEYETDKCIDYDDNSSINSETTEICGFNFKPNMINKRISVFMQKLYDLPKQTKTASENSIRNAIVLSTIDCTNLDELIEKVKASVTE
jgi:hypothetical protein